MKSLVYGVRRSPQAPDETEILAQLRRMTSDEAFARSERLRRFLEFVVEAALNGRSDELKEYNIALSVFDKGDDFDPRTDPIVRVEAGRLRSRIESYYNDHPSDTVLIRLRKRGYRPVIRRLSGTDRPGKTAAQSARPQRPGISTVVVLPFKDLSADQSQEYFCEAITERITGILPRLHVRVIAHTSALQFSDSATDVRRIGQELEADLVLEGSVQRSGRRVRVNARACRTSDGLQIWTEMLDRELREVLALQDDLAESIALGLRAVVGSEGDSEEEDGSRALRRLRVGLGRRRREYEATLDRTVDAFEAATQEADSPAAAWAHLAESLVTRMVRRDEDTVSLTERARKAAESALAIDASAATAHAVLGALRVLSERDWRGAESAFLEAMRLEPENPVPRHWYATFWLAPQGRLEEALSEIRSALSMDPDGLWPNVDLAFLYYLSGDSRRAVSQAEFVLQFESRCRSAAWVAGRARAARGDFQRALEGLEWASEASVRTAGATRGYCFARLDRRDDIARILQALRSTPERSAYALAEVYLGLGKTDRALRWLRRAASAKIPLATWAAVDPHFEELRDHPEFHDIVEILGLTVPPSLS